MGWTYLATLKIYFLQFKIGDISDNFQQNSGKEARFVEINLLCDFVLFSIRKEGVLRLAMSRWPVFHVLSDFKWQIYGSLSRLTADEDCSGSGEGGKWDQLHLLLENWSIYRESSASSFYELSPLIQDVMSDPLQKSRECWPGTLSVLLSQLLLSLDRFSQYSQFISHAVSQMFESSSFSLWYGGGSRWPIFDLLEMLSALNAGGKPGLMVDKGAAMRRFMEVDLEENEMFPLGRDLRKTEELSALQFEDFVPRITDLLNAENEKKEFSVLFQSAYQESLKVLSFDSYTRLLPPPQKSRKLIFLTYLFGRRFGGMIRRMRRHLWEIGVRAVLFVCMDRPSLMACKESHLGGEGNLPPAGCWRPPSRSAMHKNIWPSVLLQLGVDVLIFDFDTVFLKNPIDYFLNISSPSPPSPPSPWWTPPGQFMSSVEVAVMATPDSDCLNNGIIFLKSSAGGVLWWGLYVNWLWRHPYEIDQRGLDAFLPEKRRWGGDQHVVSFLPIEKLEEVGVRWHMLDYRKEFVIGAHGWTGRADGIYIFHWGPITEGFERKVKEMEIVYDALWRRYGGEAEGGKEINPVSSLSTEEVLLSMLTQYRYDEEYPPVCNKCW